MHVTGIIAEYNPFHNGHAHMIRALREVMPDTSVLALMSGSFTQRGEAAILDKWQRAEAALAGGCDLVLELPWAFALRSAQNFARGGVDLLNRLGVVNCLAFGMEPGNPEEIKKAALLVDTPKIQEEIHQRIQQGNSYAAALSSSISHATGLSEEQLKQPNTILALEYLRALHLTKSSIIPFPIERKGASHHEARLGDGIASAGAIRRELRRPTPNWRALENTLPETSLRFLGEKEHLPPPDALLHKLLLARLSVMSHEELREIYGVNEGLEYRILAALPAPNPSQFLLEISGKRYPKSRIRRTLAHILLGFTRELAEKMDVSGPQYGRVLAFNHKGRILLRAMREKSAVPLIARTGTYLHSRDLHRSIRELSPLESMLRLDCLSTDLWGILQPEALSPGLDFLRSPCMEITKD